MNKGRSKGVLILKKATILFFLLFLFACSGHSADQTTESIDMDQADFQSAEDSAVEESVERQNLTVNNTETNHNDQMIIYTGFIEVLVDDYGYATTNITQKVGELNGFVVQSTQYQHGENDNK